MDIITKFISAQDSFIRNTFHLLKTSLYEMCETYLHMPGHTDKLTGDDVSPDDPTSQLLHRTDSLMLKLLKWS